jgi:4-alpha-glucanotransferase
LEKCFFHTVFEAHRVESWPDTFLLFVFPNPPRAKRYLARPKPTVPMIIRFSLPYRTQYGQRLAVCGSHPDLGAWQPAAAANMHYDEATTCWSLELTVPDAAGELTYKYVLRNDNTGGEQWEFGPNRAIAYNAARTQRLNVADYWRTPAEPENELQTAAFTKALFRRPTKGAPAEAPAASAKKAKAPAKSKAAKAVSETVESSNK